MTTLRFHLLFVVLLPLGIGCAETSNKGTSRVNENARMPDFATTLGWVEEFNLGQDIIADIVGSNEAWDIARYRGQSVSFFAAGAPPGATNDLLTRDGIYIRVVNSAGEDLRPKSVTWTVLVKGKVLQILKEQRIIVIEIKKTDWIALDTS